ncbi:MAG: PAS domain S-box protein [Proteobacteria bacterium]|nr:PAS domain S-box protein [Pseudomonadota bacterium]MBU1649848.1 PAS domain S-box protein [Pseudomonadota bacterium]MBU1986028.1 PAS domain S-box protein [Pseudomonadota bacterium]
MTVTLSQKEIKLLRQHERRNKLLTAISELNATEDTQQTPHSLLKECCRIILDKEEFCLVWAGIRDAEDTCITPLVVLTSGRLPKEDCMRLVEQVIIEMNESNPAACALLSGNRVVIQDITVGQYSPTLHEMAAETGVRSCSSWPLLHKGYEYGVINIHSDQAGVFTESEVDFLSLVIADISLALYSQEMRSRLEIERDFNREIVDTVQALMVSISPGEEILSFNSKAEEVTGYSQEEVYKNYWVDVLMSPENRIQCQNLVSEILKGSSDNMNFQTTLLTKSNETRIIKWHASNRPDVQQSKVGLVLFGIDITQQVQADLALNRAIAKWENLFTSIQDPALIVSSDNIILDANPATFAAARKTREEVIDKKVCDILHGGRAAGALCPLEAQISTRKSMINEAELRGLNGNYLITLSPLTPTKGHQEATLLIARDLTEEEQMKAEAMRAAQLASVGELAAGVAHEINNPINGIINYAQIILDDPHDSENIDNLHRIIKEGKRIAGIVSNLLDFARRHEDSQAPVVLQQIIINCIDLINHQLKKDSIILELNVPDTLPLIMCNSQQIQQVLLNIMSNARYALNKRYPEENPNKRIIIKGEQINQKQKSYIRLTINDKGTGIEHDIMDRLFDPFFSTKPNGEGTGLGLSISHGLVLENNGFLRVSSEMGRSTSLIIDLPVAEASGGADDN